MKVEKQATIGISKMELIKKSFKFVFSKLKFKRINTVRFGRSNPSGLIAAIFGLIGLFLYIAVMLSIPTLWCMNLYKLTQCNFEAPYKAEIIYGVGTFSPTFLVTGFVDIDD